MPLKKQPNPDPFGSSSLRSRRIETGRRGLDTPRWRAALGPNGLEGFFASVWRTHAGAWEALNEANTPQAMNIPGWRLHKLKGDLKDHGSVWVSGNWRMTFTFEGQDAVLVDYQDDH